MLHIVLVSPEIPPNTGNVIRLAANTGSQLHLIKPLGFSLEDRLLKRAGLDYREYADVRVHENWKAFLLKETPDRSRMFAFTSHATVLLPEARFRDGDWLVFGRESQGLPEEMIEAEFLPENRLRIPMKPGNRSLNLSNAAAVSVFEAWRQLGYAGAV